MNELERLLLHKRVVVCCGAGGVGKTTIAAALSVAAAQRGQRVLVLTIDPSRRLAELLDVQGRPRRPVPLPRPVREAAGITGPGTLDAWVLDSMHVADQTVQQAVANKGLIQQFLDNPIYREVSAMAAGMQEYTAMKALYQFVRDGRYDLIVLDTPPSRHALDFLDAPARLERFLDFRVFQLFAPTERSVVQRAAASVVRKILDRAAGKRFARDFVAFLSQFTEVFGHLRSEVTAMRALLAGDQSAFLLVTSSLPASVQEALLFQDRVVELALPFAGYVLNRSCARMVKWSFPRRDNLGGGHAGLTDELIERLVDMAAAEHSIASTDAAVADSLRAHAGRSAMVVDVPPVLNAGTDPAGLSALAAVLLCTDEDLARRMASAANTALHAQPQDDEASSRGI